MLSVSSGNDVPEGWQARRPVHNNKHVRSTRKMEHKFVENCFFCFLHMIFSFAFDLMRLQDTGTTVKQQIFIDKGQSCPKIKRKSSFIFGQLCPLIILCLDDKVKTE